MKPFKLDKIDHITGGLLIKDLLGVVKELMAACNDLDERIARFETGAAYERDKPASACPKIIEFPRHNASMTIERNPHINEHVSIEECVSSFCPDAWASDEEREKSIESGELWTIQWYPDTPVGFLVIHASTFDAAISAAAQLQIEDGGK